MPPFAFASACRSFRCCADAKDQPVYIICQSGGRSAQATQYLEAVGHNAVNVTGGTAAWIWAQLPTER